MIPENGTGATQLQLIYEKNKLFKEMLQLFMELFDQFKFYTGMNNLEERHKTENTHESLALTSELFEKMNTQNDPRHGG